ncbi:hypothetical protein [Metasolibacillus sp. FSL K6-0083]|uniref:hypothetical protein n=1 Tax=Metasolibacillus sp. FSL K6-0083 TaxID=2921416 RepID=UPI00315A3178
MKKGLLIFSMLLFVLFLSACTKKDILTYEGEGENWHVTYTVTNTSDNSYDYSLQYYYKGNKQELKKFDEIAFRFETPLSNSGGALPITLLNLDDENKAVFGSNGSHTEVLLLNENSDLNVIITWGNNEESFKLTFTD